MHRLGAAIDAFLAEEPLRRIDVGVLLAPEGASDLQRGLPGFLGGTRDELNEAQGSRVSHSYPCVGIQR